MGHWQLVVLPGQPEVLVCTRQWDVWIQQLLRLPAGVTNNQEFHPAGGGTQLETCRWSVLSLRVQFRMEQATALSQPTCLSFPQNL